jgi:hypothetical protein
MNPLKNITLLGWLGIIILFNTTLIGGASQLGDLSLSVAAVKAILAIATLGNGFLGGLVTLFSTSANMAKSVDQGTLVKSVLAMDGVQHIDVNAKASQTLAAIAVDPNVNKIAPTPAAMQEVTATAKAAA